MQDGIFALGVVESFNIFHMEGSKYMSSITRSMARAIARSNMKKAGYTKRDHGSKEEWSGFFHRNWRLKEERYADSEV